MKFIKDFRDPLQGTIIALLPKVQAKYDSLVENGSQQYS
jgi:hypothetical protein